jgi:membrane protein implicated in regulation of membrane protease activity
LQKRPLKLHATPGSRLWFFPDGSIYVYYEPTHWRATRLTETAAGKKVKVTA